MKFSISNLSVLLLLSATACEADGPEVDIGDDGPIETLGSKLSDYSGTWTGYTEAYEFVDGSDEVQLTLDGAGNGSMKMGSAVLKPNPGLWSVPTSGFAYTVKSSQVTDNRIRFSVQNAEAYREYCATREVVQTEWGPSCGVNAPVCDSPQQSDSECFESSCSSVCRCTMEGCQVSEATFSTPPVGESVDAALTEGGSVLVGTVVIEEQRITVRLRRR